MTENVSYLLNLLLDDPGADGLGSQADEALGQKLPQGLLRESPVRGLPTLFLFILSSLPI